MNEFSRLTLDEQTFAFPTESDAETTLRTPPVTGSARATLEEIVQGAFTGAPVYVLFSGGRDSSAVLALASRVARRLGAPDPVPVTVQHPDAPRSSEVEWQEVVLSHLSIRERIIFEFRGEQSLLGEAAQAGLTSHGLLWPPALHLHGAIYRQLASGVILTGEGGDLAIAGRRITPFVEAVRNRWARTSLREAARLVAIRKTRQELCEALLAASPWLTRHGQARLREVMRPAHEPMAWNRALHTVVNGRPATMSRANFTAKVRAHGHTPINPLDDATFFSALEAEGGMWGLGTRTDMMRHLFHDLLPDAILSRPTKASFNETRWMAPERAFAASWSGAGVDTDLIDVERLRSEWLSDSPSTLSSVSLHAAWLADNGLPVAPNGL